MDPDVESVVFFPGVSRAVELSYGAKQLIAHEIELEKMRRWVRNLMTHSFKIMFMVHDLATIVAEPVLFRSAPGSGAKCKRDIKIFLL